MKTFNKKQCRICKTVFQPNNAKNHFCSLACSFWSKVDKKSDNECWLWLGTINTHGLPYGRMASQYWKKGKILKAATVSWVVHYGEIPEHYSYHGICVLHKCDNPVCVNPKHLFLGTHADNMNDMVKKGRSACVTGIKNPSAKLNDKKVIEIRKHLKNKIPLRRIAKMYGVGGTTILRIKQNTHWKHI